MAGPSCSCRNIPICIPLELIQVVAADVCTVSWACNHFFQCTALLRCDRVPHRRVLLRRNRCFLTQPWAQQIYAGSPGAWRCCAAETNQPLQHSSTLTACHSSVGQNRLMHWSRWSKRQLCNASPQGVQCVGRDLEELNECACPLRHYTHTSCRSGLKVTLGFFSDVFIPEKYMQTPGSAFDVQTQQWEWTYEGERLPLPAGACLRFKVRDVSFPTLASGSPQPALYLPLQRVTTWIETQQAFKRIGLAAVCSLSWEAVL